MEIKYEIVPTDIAHFSKEAARGTTSNTIQTIIICSIGVLFIFSDLIFALFSPFINGGCIEFRSVHLLPRIIAYFAILAISYFVLMTVGKARITKVLNNVTGKNGLFCEHTITLDDKGFTETTDVNRNFTYWEGVEKITETKNYVAISQRLGSNYFIPKRAFTDENQIKAFIASVSSYIDHASIPPPPDFN